MTCTDCVNSPAIWPFKVCRGCLDGYGPVRPQIRADDHAINMQIQFLRKSRMTYRTIARVVGLSRSAVHVRAKKGGCI